MRSSPSRSTRQCCRSRRSAVDPIGLAEVEQIMDLELVAHLTPEVLNRKSGSGTVRA